MGTKKFILAALFLLVSGLVFGIFGSLQYVMPGFLKTLFSFEKIRPLHVSSVIFWIIISSTGAVLTYMQEYTRQPVYSRKLMNIQFGLFIVSVLSIFISYCAGIFGGRKYWEYPPVLSIPVIAGWILFLINFILTIKKPGKKPVYAWMWMTGIIFFLFTFLESYLWLFPYFRNNIINDMTIQWKSYGSMVGAWNMLIYGSSFFLMEKISGNRSLGNSWPAFALYFAGLFNLMFNWGHHIYTLPTHNFIKHISYTVSMTELLILGWIIYNWRSSLTKAQKYYYRRGYMFLAAADVWIFLNILLAILMSIPAVNIYTHGTHITVAHVMGTTIGINTMILLAIAFDILAAEHTSFDRYRKVMKRGFWLSNISLLFFWLSLIGAGIAKAKWQMSKNQIPFNDMMREIRPFFYVFFCMGILLSVGIIMVIYPLIHVPLVNYFNGRANKIGIQNHNSPGPI